MRNGINHITKLEFLPCFIAAYKDYITESNIQGSFRGAGLVPLDPEAVISKMDVRLRTPTPPAVDVAAWVSITPSNSLEIGSQSRLVRESIQRHIDSSPTSMVDVVEKLAKDAERMAHELVLMNNQVKQLQKANAAAPRRKARKRKRIQAEGVLTAEEGMRLTTLKEFAARGDRKKAKKSARAEGSEPTQRGGKRCSEAGHNSRTCKKEV